LLCRPARVLLRGCGSFVRVRSRGERTLALRAPPASVAGVRGRVNAHPCWCARAGCSWGRLLVHSMTRCGCSWDSLRGESGVLVNCPALLVGPIGGAYLWLAARWREGSFRPAPPRFPLLAFAPSEPSGLCVRVCVRCACARCACVRVCVCACVRVCVCLCSLGCVPPCSPPPPWSRTGCKHPGGAARHEQAEPARQAGAANGGRDVLPASLLVPPAGPCGCPGGGKRRTCGLPPAACRLPPAACRLPLAACRMPHAACRDCGLGPDGSHTLAATRARAPAPPHCIRSAAHV
jgi:hypothetical protein